MSSAQTSPVNCVEVLSALILLIDGEIEETSQVQAIETHIQECLPCRSEISHERRMHQMLHEMLTRSCCEKAPQEFHDELAQKLFAAQSSTAEVRTEITMTEISIQIDEFGQIEHREITIESTQEYRLPREE